MRKSGGVRLRGGVPGFVDVEGDGMRARKKTSRAIVSFVDMAANSL